MAQIPLTTEQRKELIRILSVYGNVNTALQRQHFFENTGLSEAIPETLPTIPLEGDTQSFCQTLVSALQKRGTLPQTQQPALVLVLRYLRDEVVSGQEAEAAFLDSLLVPTQPKGEIRYRLRLFISYRRKSWAFTQRLAEQLRQSLDADIFVDLTGVDESNFERAILRNLRESDAVLLVVSEHTFSNRIHEPNDWVRREIAEALRLNKPITLVAVDGLFPPPADQLPDDIAHISKMQGVRFYPEPELWDGALRRLVNFLGKVTRTLQHEPDPHPNPVSLKPPSATPASLQATLTNALHFLDVGDWDKALVLLGELAAQGYRNRFVSLEELAVNATTQRNQAIRHREMMEAYQEIVPFTKVKATQSQALKAWQQFRREYPDFDLANDTANLQNLRKAPSDAIPNRVEIGEEIYIHEIRSFPDRYRFAVLEVMVWQQRLVDIIQDMRVPVEERAKAGIELAKVGDPRPGVGLREDGVPDIVWCEVPGKDKGRPPVKIGGDDKAYQSLPTQMVDLPTFAISKYPITYRQFQAFIEDKGFENDQWWEPGDDRSAYEQSFKDWNHPRETITWYAAMAFCKWMSSKLGYLVRLPTEQEWEKAARGESKYAYPWGNHYIVGHANVNEVETKVGTNYLTRTTSVGIYPLESASPYSVMDMAGNVWEWTFSAHNLNLQERERKSDQILNNKLRRVLRGGSWYSLSHVALSSSRESVLPFAKSNDWGFRIVRTMVL